MPPDMEKGNIMAQMQYPTRPSGSYLPLVKRSNLEETIGRCLEESSKRQDNFKEWIKRFRESTDKNLKRHDSKIKGHEKKVMQLAQAVHTSKIDDSNQSITSRQLLRRAENILKTSKATRLLDLRLLLVPLLRKKTPYYANRLEELMSKKTIIKEVSMLRLNAQCSAVLQNELPLKEKDPGCFIFPCIIGSMTVRRPMLATVHARIDVFGKKIPLEVRGSYV
nr:hypothetical protein [Tanacetum cinerariifolium]